jgi:hypothetical protein
LAVQLVSNATLKGEGGIVVDIGALAVQSGAGDSSDGFRYGEMAADLGQYRSVPLASGPSELRRFADHLTFVGNSPVSFVGARRFWASRISRA